MGTDLGKVFVSLTVLITGLAWTASEAKAQGSGGPSPGVVELHRDVSRPLRDIEPEVPHRGPAHPIPLQHPAPGTGPGGLYADPVLQTTLGPSADTTAGLGFDGVGTGFTGPQGTYAVGVAPPDTNGAVGATQYVQWVNLSFAVFDKKTGSALYGPAAGNTLWSGFGGACQSTNDGDVIAQYDKLANRWVMAQLSYAQAPPFLLCLAVSTTSDATGSYYRYSFSYSGNLNDYPKVGVWPDGYYVTANMFLPVGGGWSYVGPEVCAFDRNSMLSGGASNTICKTLSSGYSSLLPADLDGTNPPPAGSPNYLLALGGSSSLYLWKFKPNFSNGTSTLSGPTTISVALYNDACGGGACIPQVQSTQPLDSLGERLMYRLAYRNLNGTETLLANHSVATTVGGSSTVGVRWYEIRNPNGTPSLNQQSTWAPDVTFRWMGSLAMDKVGNIALGYSASSSSIHPGVRYTGHQPSVDASGVMEAENSILEGTGSQQSGLDRWGDYSSMSVDPVDDCTFWYTTEYLKANGAFNWSTRIASFSFPSCTGAASTPDLSLAAAPTSQSVTQGTNANYTITVSSLNTFSGSVSLSVGSGCPTNATCSVTPSVSVSSGGSANATLSVTNTASVQVGTYPSITVTGTSGSTNHSTSVSLTVNAPTAADFSISASPGSLTLKKNQSGKYTVSITPSGGFNSSVTVLANCPSGFTCSFAHGGIIAAGSGSDAYTVTNLSAPRNSNYTVTFNASGGGKSHATSVGLKSR